MKMEDIFCDIGLHIHEFTIQEWLRVWDAALYVQGCAIGITT